MSKKLFDAIELFNSSKVCVIFVRTNIINKTSIDIVKRFKKNGFNVILSYSLHHNLLFHKGKNLFTSIENVLSEQSKTENQTDLSSILQQAGGEDLASVLARIEQVAVLELEANQPRILFVCKNLQLINDAKVYAAISELAYNARIRNLLHCFIFIVPKSYEIPEDLRTVVGVIDRPLPESEEFKKILDESERKGHVITDDLELILDTAKGLNEVEFERACLMSIHKHKTITVSEIKAMKEYVFSQNPAIEIVESKLGFERIGGYNKIKEFFRTKIVKRFRDTELTKKLGLGLPRGILMFGNPGTGKSIFSESLSKEVELPLIKLHISRLFSKYVGETEAHVKAVLELIDTLSPCVIFIDEIDTAVQSRSDTSQQHETTSRMFGELLDYMGREDRNNCIIVASNYPSRLDSAFLRAGRIDYIVPILLPEFEARKEIFKVHLTVVNPVNLADDIEFDKLAQLTEDFTGADIRQVTIIARENALARDSDTVNMKDLLTAISDYIIDKNEIKRQKEYYLNCAKTMRVLKSLLPSELTEELDLIDITLAKQRLKELEDETVF